MSVNDWNQEAGLKPETPELGFKRLSAESKLDGFCCGEKDIEQWIKNKAFSEHKNLKSRVVTAHLKNNPRPCGFYSMSFRLEPESHFLNNNHKANFRSWFKYGYLATVHLCWVGVQKSMQRNGFGTVIMGHAIQDFYEIVVRTGIPVLTLTSIDVERAEFYRRLGFQEYGEKCSNPKMFLPAEVVLELIENENNAC